MSTEIKADKSTFGGRLKLVRTQLGLNQSEMAGQIGVSKDTLSRYERGELTPSIDVLKRIIESYSSEGVTADALLLDAKPSIPTYCVENIGWATGFNFQNGGAFEIAIGFNDLARLCESMIVFTEMNIPLTEALHGAADALKDVNNGFEPSDDPFLEDVHEINTMSYLKVITPIAQQAASLIPTFLNDDKKKDKLVAKYMKEVEKVEKLKDQIVELKKRLKESH